MGSGTGSRPEGWREGTKGPETLQLNQVAPAVHLCPEHQTQSSLWWPGWVLAEGERGLASVMGFVSRCGGQAEDKPGRGHGLWLEGSISGLELGGVCLGPQSRAGWMCASSLKPLGLLSLGSLGGCFSPTPRPGF